MQVTGVATSSVRTAAGREGAVATNELGMRKSCDSCGRKKRKCDGNMPCRCRLSASPATGLVGMQENAFLSDFFCCIGFLPLATQSHIRETIVKMLARPAIGQPSQVPPNSDEPFAAITPEDSFNPSLRGSRLPKDLSTCVFWCAVALGALVKGNPVESVANYSQLARDALETYSGPANAEVARAWTILAYLYLFCGNLDMYQEYMELSGSFLTASMEQGLTEILPVGFAEIVHHRTAVKICCGDIDKVASFCAQEQAPPQLNEAASESELYAFVMRSYGTVQQAVYAAAYSARVITGGNSSDVEPGNVGEEVDPRLFGASAEVLDTIAGRLKEYSCQFGRLEEAVDRPSIRTGIGGLMINGTLFFEKAAKGDFHGTLERIGRCVEVFERFPGLCRFEMGAHAAHITITALSAMDGPTAGELYSTLRTTYNLTRLPGAASLPPLEEWQGISHFCDSCYCRAMERLILSKEMNVFSIRADASGIHQKDTRTNGEFGNRFGDDGQTNGLLPTSILSERTAASAPANIEAGFDLPDTCKANSGSPLVLHGGAEWRTAPILALTSPVIPNGETQAVPNADLCGAKCVVHGGRTGAGVVLVEAPEALLVGPGFSGWGGETNGTRNKGEIAVEDWLEVTHALFDTVADS